MPDFTTLINFRKKTHQKMLRNATFLLCMCSVFSASGQVEMKINRHYLNIPVGYLARMKLIELRVNGKLKRELPVQLAEDSIGYWIYVDVSEFSGQKRTISAPAKEQSLKRIYQDDRINGADSLYKDCLLYTSDAADDLLCVDLGGRRI